MKKVLAAVIMLFAPILCFSQDAQSEDSQDEQESYTYNYNINQKGDQFIKIALSPVFPLNFPDFNTMFNSEKRQLNPGGMGALGYHRFVSNNFAVGFDVGFGFNVTIGSHVFNYVPVLTSFTYEPTFKKFQFPLTLNIGFAWESYANKNYFPGLIIKPEAGVFYRLADSWALGGEVSYMVMPQFCELYNTGKNYIGQFGQLALVARYCF